MTFLAVLAPLVLAASPTFAPDSVRINLFSLFKPESLNVRVASGEAVLEMPGAASAPVLTRGQVIRIRRSSDRLSIMLPATGGFPRSLACAEARIVPSKSATLELVLPGKISRPVRGVVLVDAGPNGRGPLRIVLTADRESAVASVVAAEMDSHETEALKALAVVVRTYMRAHAGRHSSEGFDFCDTTHCQVYKGEDGRLREVRTAAVDTAVAQTAGQVLTFHGRVIDGYYGAVCGGFTATPSMVWGGASDYPYRRISCGWCRRSGFRSWERSANALRVLRSLSSYLGTSLSLAADLSVESDDSNGFVRSVVVADAGRRRELSADAFRRSIGLALGWNTVLSPTFTIERRGARFIFRGRGFGSQVGLCEAGAVAQSAGGRSYREILSFYYADAQIGETGK